VVPRRGGLPPCCDESQQQARGDDNGRDAGHHRPLACKGRVGVLCFDILFLEVVLDRGGDGEPCDVVCELVAEDHEGDASEHPQDQGDGGDVNHRDVW